MRAALATVIAFSTIAFGAPAYALTSNDTMQAWAQAPLADRTRLLENLLGTAGGDVSGVRKCLDAASEVGGHAALEIGQVAKACAAAKNDGDPV